MNWTTNIPSIKGFYWVKCRGMMSGNEYIQVAKFYSSQMNNIVDMCYLEGENYSVRHSQMSVRCNPANIEAYSDKPLNIPKV